MKYFAHVPNIFINAGGYLRGFLGLSWLPSEAAKARVDRYERAVAALLYKMWGKSSAAKVLYEIGRTKKRVEIVPPEFSSDSMPKDANAYPEPQSGDWQGALKKGTPGATCDESDKAFKVKGTGAGADSVVSFNPFARMDVGPGSDQDEVLLHELVRAMRYSTGAAARCFGAPKGYGGDYEEFVAVPLTNVYASESKRALRRDLEGFKVLQSPSASSEGFFSEYRAYILPLRAAHPNLYTALNRSTGITFNPFMLM